ncbi:hypothetical protein BDZ97DRAFT_1706198, partial [Flammula alnicola]
MARIRSQGKRSTLQKQHLHDVNKENVSPTTGSRRTVPHPKSNPKAPAQTPTQPFAEIKNKLANCQRKVRHLQKKGKEAREEITVAFFRGSLATWERFSSEFAPGGVIDEASAEEKHLAWMPATNDVNEGALGAY